MGRGISLLPILLIPALFGLGGVFFGLCITVFHYFNEKVDQTILEKMRELFSSSTTDSFLQMIKDGSLPLHVLKDFNKDLFKITESRRRFRSLLLFLPFTGGLFISSASFASVSMIENELVTLIMPVLEFLTYSTLLVAFVMIGYCAFQLAKLARGLA